MSFNWHTYLSETGAEICPASLFDHVCQSMQPLIREGETVEVVSHFSENTLGSNVFKWWPAEVVSISGCMILFKWCLPDSVPMNHTDQSFSPTGVPYSSANGFWFDVKGRHWNLIRPIGTTQPIGQNWFPPIHLSHLASAAEFTLSNDWLESLKKRSVLNVFFERRVLYFYETIQIGGYFECEHEDNPCCVWPAKVLVNVGGRIKVAWFGMDDKMIPERSSDDGSTFTLFYLHRRVHPLGWGKFHHLTYSPPPGLVPDRKISNMDAFIRNALSAFVHLSSEDRLLDLKKIRPGHPLYRSSPPAHEFKVGWKLEAVNPRKPYTVQPAAVAEVFNSRYFLVELDDLVQAPPGCGSEQQNANHRSPAESRIRFVSHACSPEIMPVNTSQLRGLHLVPPRGWPSTRPFTWTNYLTFLSGPAEQLLPSVKLENGSCKATCTTAHSSPSTEQTFELKPDTSEPVHSPPNNCLPPTSPNTLFCPSESVFKGIQVSHLPPPDTNSDTHSQPNSNPPPTVFPDDPPDVESNICINDHNHSRFLLGMKLEVVIPAFVLKTSDTVSDIGPKLCTATVTRVDEPHLLWLLLDIRDPCTDKPINPIMVDGCSTDLYPVGWAQFFGHPIVPPIGYEERCEDESRNGPAQSLPDRKTCESSLLWNVGLRPTHDLQYLRLTYDSEEFCPAVYINTKCYLGPFLCRASLDLIPQRFGPGPTARVMHSLLNRLVNVAYKPIRILRMFEADWASGLSSALANFRAAERAARIHHTLGCPSRGRFTLQSAKANLRQAEREALEQRRSNMRVVLLHVRCPRRGVKIEAPVEVCCKARAVEEFCRQVSLVLEACPHLISIHAPIRESTGGLKPNSATGSAPSGPKQLNSIKFFDTSLGYMLDNPACCECPSFCGSRMRSRTLDRLPGWKRRMFASLRPFGVQPPTSGGQGQSSSRGSNALFANGLRTRSAAAAAQRQHVLSGALSPMRQFSGVSNCLPISRTTKRHRGRVSGRFRDPPVRRTPGQLGAECEVDANAVCGLKRHCNAVDSQKPTQERDVALQQDEQQVVTTSSANRNTVNQNNSLHCLYRQHSWVNHQSPYVTSSLCSSHRYRLHNRPFFTHDHYLQDSSLNAILSDAPHVTLSSNPLFWSSVDLASYLGGTDCREMWPWLAAEAVDGQAFMLLTLPVLHHLVGLRWEDAVRLARHVVSVKRAFMEQFSNDTNDIKTS